MNSGRRSRYLLSLPERVLRSAAAVSGGLLRELGAIVLPERIRRTALYRTMVEVTLRFLIEQVGQVNGVYPDSGGLANNFLLKRGASHGIELIGLLTIHVSPIWVLAALADLTGAGHGLIREIAQALKSEGLLPEGHHFETADQLLDGLEKTSAQLAENMNMPPLDVKSLRREWLRLRENLPSIHPELPRLENLERLWLDLKASALAQHRPVFAVCSSVALSAITEIPESLTWLSRAAMVTARRTGQVFGQALLLHYVEAAGKIARTGFIPYWQRQFRPYLRGAAEQFEMERRSSTERLLERGSE